MKKLLVSLLLLAASVVGYKLHSRMLIDNAHKASHFIKLKNQDILLLIFSEGEVSGHHSCSSVAVAPHALLTAAHCDGQGNDFEIDDKPAHINARIFDGNEHLILLLSGAPFKDYVRISEKFLNQGDEVYLYGNPMGDHKINRDFYRKGYVMGVSNEEDGDVVMLDLNGFYGDSGGALFDGNGNVLSVMSKMWTSDDKDSANVMKEMAVYDFKFRPDELERAYNYKP